MIMNCIKIPSTKGIIFDCILLSDESHSDYKSFLREDEKGNASFTKMDFKKIRTAVIGIIQAQNN